MDLSNRRAKSVMRSLLERGIEPKRLRAVGYGETKPIQSNKTNAGRAKNRRVEFMIEEQE
jgi:outer membrane protein OmpA-like peptidoglycan-associated protein